MLFLSQYYQTLEFLQGPSYLYLRTPRASQHKSSQVWRTLSLRSTTTSKHKIDTPSVLHRWLQEAVQCVLYVIDHRVLHILLWLGKSWTRLLNPRRHMHINAEQRYEWDWIKLERWLVLKVRSVILEKVDCWVSLSNNDINRKQKKWLRASHIMVYMLSGHPIPTPWVGGLMSVIARINATYVATLFPSGLS